MLVRLFFGGTAVGSVINFAPTIFPNLSLSGKARRLTKPELNAVNMGLPHKFNGGTQKHTSMNIPVDMGIPVTLGKGGGGGRWAPRGTRSYAGRY